MLGDYLLDTNIMIAVFREQPAVLTRLRAAPRVFIAPASIGELFFGAFKSARKTENLTRANRFIANCHVVTCDTSTGRVFGQIKAEQQAKGQPIPDNDLWIAASARQHGLTPATRDAHFLDVTGLAIEAW